jgi:DNA-binding beta-propeller fold protein YncE
MYYVQGLPSLLGTARDGVLIPCGATLLVSIFLIQLPIYQQDLFQQTQALSLPDGEKNSGSVTTNQEDRPSLITGEIKISEPGRLAVNPKTNMIYVFNVFNGQPTISVINATTNTVVHTITLQIPLPSHSERLAVNPNTNMLYVTSTDLDSVFVINGTTNAKFALWCWDNSLRIYLLTLKLI